MRLFIDLDGVLADYYGGVCRLFGVPPWPYRPPVGDWNFFAHPPLSKTTADVAPHMGFDFYANLDLLPDAFEITCSAELTAPGQVYLLTAPWDTPGCRDGKAAWVAKHLPAYTKKLLVGTPKEACSFPGSVLLDDSEVNCRKFAAVENPGHAVIVPRPWNCRHAESDLTSGAVLDLAGLFHGYGDGRPANYDRYVEWKKCPA